MNRPASVWSAALGSTRSRSRSRVGQPNAPAGSRMLTSRRRRSIATPASGSARSITPAPSSSRHERAVPDLSSSTKPVEAAGVHVNGNERRDNMECSKPTVGSVADESMAARRAAAIANSRNSSANGSSIDGTDAAFVRQRRSGGVMIVVISTTRISAP